jgi:tRNA nucleotidyltransferase (CCA-adding enzyme)
MNEHEKIREKILKKVTPTQSDRTELINIIQEITEKVQCELDKRTIDATIELVGSTAKDTYLRGSLDIDLFLIYPLQTPREYMAKQTLAIGKDLLQETEECYAEHPYIRGYFRSYLVELVPCYQVDDAAEKQSAVDRTPLHTKYVLAHITSKQKQEIRLFKQFLKGIGCYGAEAAVRGFSGYLCEILILYYKTFHQLLIDAQTWKKGLILSLDVDNPLSFPEPLTFIDPVDHERNVASAVSINTFNQFKNASKAYIEHPSETFFFPNHVKPWPLSKIQEMLSTQPFRYLGILFQKPPLIPETLIPQIQKACRSIKKECESNGFIIYDIQYEIVHEKNQIYIIIKTDPNPLSPTFIHMGPPITQKKHTYEFNKKWRNHSDVMAGPFEKKGRSYVELKRTYQHLDTFLQEKLTTFSLGKNLDSIIQTSYKILDNNALLTDELTEFWTKYLDKKEIWER